MHTPEKQIFWAYMIKFYVSNYWTRPMLNISLLAGITQKPCDFGASGYTPKWFGSCRTRF